MYRKYATYFKRNFRRLKFGRQALEGVAFAAVVQLHLSPRLGSFRQFGRQFSHSRVQFAQLLL